MTGTIPTKINIIQERLSDFKPKEAPKEIKSISSIATETDEIEKTETSTQTDDIEALTIEQMEMIITNPDGLPNAIIAPPSLFEDESVQEEKTPLRPKPNDLMIKILNKSTTGKTPAKQFKKSSNVKIEKIETIKPKILNSQIQLPKTEEEPHAIIESIDEENIEIIHLAEGEFLEEEEDPLPNSNMDKSEDGVVYTCNVCERSFPLLQQLEIHKENHERPREHPCNLCGK